MYFFATSAKNAVEDPSHQGLCGLQYRLACSDLGLLRRFRRNGGLRTLRKSPVVKRSQLETVVNVALIDSILSYRVFYSFNIIITCQI